MKNYYFCTKKEILEKNKEAIWLLLKDCFWSKDIPIEYIERFIHHSLCFGVYESELNHLVGFGRVISDYTTYAYICDVIINKEHRRKGLGKALMDKIMSHPELQGLKTWSLRTTEEARKIYESRQFKIAEEHKTILEINNLEIYQDKNFVNLYSKEPI